MSNFLALQQQRLGIASDIPEQFPDIYRHEHPMFVEFVKAYYEASEDNDNLKFRNIRQHSDIDNAYCQFLENFRKKYLRGFPTIDDDKTRFIVKHIFDLYKRKGTEESIRLLFRLFFQEEIELYYPGKNVFKTSDSIYKSTSYIEMKPVLTSKGYPITPGNFIRGDVSKANAYVDEVVFKNFSGAIVPIVYISNITGGTFSKDDSLTMETFSGDTTIVGRLIRGSISDVEVLPGGRTDENKEGDIYDLVSESGGIVGRVIATAIEELETGSIDFDIVDSGYGYSIVAPDTFEGTAILNEDIERGDTSIAVRNSTFTANDARTLRFSIKFPAENNKEVYYEIVNAIGAGGSYTLTLNKPIEFGAIPSGSEIQFFITAQVPEIVNSNQVFVIDTNVTAANNIIQPTDLNLQLGDILTATSAAVVPEEAFSEGNGIVSYLNQYTFSGSAEVIAQEESLVYVKADANAFQLTVKPSAITDYTYYTSTNGVDPDFEYAVGNFVRYENVVYECIRVHKPQPKFNNAYFRLPILNRIPDNARVALTTPTGEQFYVKTMSPFNDSAGFRISQIKNSENLQVITDKIGNFASTVIGQSDYQLSGSGAQSLSTQIGNAFTPVDLTLGEVADIQILDNGAAYENDIKSVVRQPYTYSYNKQNLIVQFHDEVEIWDSTTFEPLDVDGRILDVKSVATDIFTMVIDGNDVVIRSNSEWTLKEAALKISAQINEALLDIASPYSTVTPGSTIINIGQNLGITVELLPANLESEVDYPISGKFSDYFNMIPGETITQTIDINDIAFQKEGYLVRLEFVKSYNSRHFFRQKSYYALDADTYLIQSKQPNVRLNAISVKLDTDSNAMGNNALINGNVYFARGQIDSVRVLNSGYRYRDGEIVKLVNVETGETSARARLKVSGTGFSEGEWKTTNSFTSSINNTSRLHDNDYYQEYSYEVSSIISPEKYSAIVSDLIQPAGTKQFDTPFINSRDKIGPEVDVALEIYNITEEPIEAEGYSANTDVIGAVAESGTVDELVAVVAELDPNLTLSI